MSKIGERLSLEAVAQKMMQDANVTRHIVDSRPHYCRGATIHAPEVRNVADLYIFAHECGHAAYRHPRKHPKWLAECEAERWAHEAFMRHGLRVPKRLTKSAKENVRMEISCAWDSPPERMKTAREAAEWVDEFTGSNR